MRLIKGNFFGKSGRCAPVILSVLFLGGSGVAAASPTVTVTNATRGGSTSFFDGDGFVINVNGGLANSPVTLSQTKNGVIFSTNVFEGTSNGSGSIQFAGVILASEVGSWTETWYVGGVQAAPVLAFTVANIASVPILVPNTVPNSFYLYNDTWSVDTNQNYSGLPHLFFEGNANDPPLGLTRQNCPFVQNPDTGYEINPRPFSWYLLYTTPLVSATGTPLASPGEYMESPQFNYPFPSYQTTGFVFDGEFVGQAVNPQTASQYYLEAAYVGDRQCADGGAEYGLYRFPVLGASGVSQNQPPNVLTFYYSEFTNCNDPYECAYLDNGAQLVQKTNTYTITLNQTNQAGTYEFNFQVFRSNANYGGGLVSNFVLSITDPQTGQIGRASCRERV